jgi:mRNA-degrading endonuclease toxin of MazEF toxin-antitoxin module
LRFPEPGDVIRYGYLFVHEFRAGGRNARKARPCLVIASNAATKIVTVLALTTQHDKYPGTTLVPPKGTIRSIPLPDVHSAVVIDQINFFKWVGYDVEYLLNSHTPYYGHVNPAVVKMMVDALSSGHFVIDRR